MTGSTAIQRDRTAAYAPALMEVSGVTKRYGEQRALADISFAVNAGEVLGLIGPNGAGKTTLAGSDRRPGARGRRSRFSGAVRPLPCRTVASSCSTCPTGCAPGKTSMSHA